MGEPSLAGPEPEAIVILVRLGLVRQATGLMYSGDGNPNVPQRRPLAGLVVQGNTVDIVVQESQRLTHNPCSVNRCQEMHVAMFFSQEGCEQET